ncbi:hypothetical protein R1flu_013103 [Riccia fluitans]|uniref:Uncharacterized protein n=1 Tax=Riccia fluitans TaxID=41844 RepID=A0ABD1ZCH9_9MARC
MLAGGLAYAVKEYVRKFSRGPGQAVVMALAQPQPRKRRAPTSSSVPARETQTATRPTRTTRTTAEPEVGVVPSPPREVQELSSSSSPEQPPRKEPRVEEPPQQAEGRQEDTTIPGFEPSDDELPIGTLRRNISRLRQEVQRTEPLVIREVGGEGPAGRQGPLHTGGQTVSAPEPLRRLQTGAGRQAFNGFRQRAIEQIPLPPSGQKKKKNKTPAVQSGPGGNLSAQPPAREQCAAPVTIEEERSDIRPRYTDKEVRRFHPELFVQLGPAPPTAGVPQPVEKTLLDRLAEISRPEAMSGTAEEDQAVRNMVRDPDLPCIIPGETSEASMARYSEQMVAVVKHWTMEKADGRTDALTSIKPSVVTLAKFFLNQIPQVPGLTIPAPATNCIDKLQTEDLKALRETYCLITTPEEPTAQDLVECLVLQNSITDHRAEEAEKRVQERDKEFRQAQDELRQAREELAQTRADGKKQSRALEEELRSVRNDVVQREEETGLWIRNDEKMADFVREIARLQEELLAKDAKMRELEKTLREHPEEIQPGQIESA